jgi:hypothetical protein
MMKGFSYISPPARVKRVHPLAFALSQPVEDFGGSTLCILNLKRLLYSPFVDETIVLKDENLEWIAVMT